MVLVAKVHADAVVGLLWLQTGPLLLLFRHG